MSTFSPLACSGLMYDGVPTMWPLWVSAAASWRTSLAMPKSISLTAREPSSMTLDVFRSRWTMPT